MSEPSSKTGERLERIQRQHEQDAEHILEEIMKRQRYSPNTRDALAVALGKVARGVPLRRSYRA